MVGGGRGVGVVTTAGVGVGAMVGGRTAVVAGGRIGVGVASASVLQAVINKVKPNKNHKGIYFFIPPIFATGNTLVKTT